MFRHELIIYKRCCLKLFYALQECFGEVAMFFYDNYAGTKIGIVWKRESLSPHLFKVS